MAETVGSIQAIIGADVAPLSSGVDTANRKLDALGNKMESLNRPLAVLQTRFRALGTAANALAGAVNVAAITRPLKAAIQAASDAEETMDLIRDSFGPLAEDTLRWSEDTANALGRSTQQMRFFASTMQAMLVPMVGSQEAAAEMSKRLSELAVDLGSFYNTADEDALLALRSALAGETEPMRRFGVVLTEAQLQAFAYTQGIRKSVAAMTEAEKVQLRYQFILSKTALAHGSTARTAENWAARVKQLEGQLSTLREEVGSRLLPIFTDAVAGLTNLVRWFNNLDDRTQDIIVKVAAVGAGMIGAVSAISVLSFALSSLAGIASLVGAVLGLIFSPFVLGVVGAIAAAGALKGAWDQNLGGIQDKARAVWADLEPIYNAAKEKVKAAWQFAVDLVGDAASWLKDVALPWLRTEGWQALKTAWEWTLTGAGIAWDWITDKLWPWLKQAASTTWDWLVQAGGAAWEWLSGPAWQWISKTASTTWEWLVNAAGVAWEWLSGPAWEWISKTASTTWEWLVEWGNYIGAWLFNVAIPWVASTVDTIWSWSISVGNWLFDWIANTAWPWISSTVSTVWEWAVRIPGWLQGFIELVVETGGRVLDKLTSFVSFGGGGGGGAVPGYRTGAIMPGKAGPDQFPALLAPGEAVVPAWAVAGGWKTVLAWFQAQGLPGFRTGLAPTVIEAASRFTGVDVGALIEPLKSGFGDLLDMIRSGLTSIFSFIVDLIDKVGEALLGEERYERLKESLASLRDRIASLLPKARDASDTAETATDALDDLAMAAQEAAQPSLWEKVKIGLWEAGYAAKEFAAGLASRFPILKDAMDAFAHATSSMEQGGLGLGIGGGIGAAVSSLLSQSKQFETIVKAVNVIFGMVADALGSVLAPLMPLVVLLEVVAVIIEAFVAPIVEFFGSVMEALWPVFRFVAVIVLHIAKAIGNVWNGILGAISSVFRSLGNIKVFGVRPLGFLRDWADSIDRAKVNTDKLAQMIQELNGMTFEEAKARVEHLATLEDLDETTQEVNESLKNVPSGFKAVLTRFSVANPVPMAQGGIVTGPTLALIGEGPDDEAVIPLNEQNLGAIGGTTIIVQFSAPVYGLPNFERAVVEAVNKAARMNNLAAKGLARR